MKSILTILFSFLFIVSGFSQTRNVVVDTNGVVVQPTNIWTANATNARSGLGLGSAATNPASAFQPSSSVLSNLASSNGVNLTNIPVAGVVGALTTNGNGFGLTNLNATNISGIVSLVNGGTGATNASDARINLGLSSTNDVSFNRVQVGNSLVATNGFLGNVLIGGGQSISFVSGGSPATTRTNLGLGATNDVTFKTIIADPLANGAYGFRFGTNLTGLYIGASYNDIYFAVGGSNVFRGLATNINFEVPVSFSSPAQTRTNLGLGWSALTNSNAGTSLVSVNTNGEVASPTNFWQVAPIQTLVQSSAPNTNSTNAATNARNLYYYSLATNIINATNTITLPTNTSAFDGDEVTVIHRGGSNSVTTVRQLGSTNNLISLNSYDEAVKFIKDGSWDFYHNISYTEAIQFSGTNASVNAAASVTNLFAPNTPLVFTTNGQVVANTGTNMLTFTNSVSLSGVAGSSGFLVWNPTDNEFYAAATFNGEIAFNNTTNAAATRTNLGLPLAALTNTNNTKFQEAIFATNAAPTNGGTFGDHAAWMGVSIVTNGVTNVFKIPLYK